MELTDKQLRLMCPRLLSARRAVLLPEVNAAMARYDVLTPHRPRLRKNLFS